MKPSNLVICAALLLPGGAALRAEVLHTLTSPNGQDDGLFGCTVSAAGDVDNDGYDDVIVGAYGEDAGATDAGAAYIFSGQTGELIASLPIPNPEPLAYFGCAVSGAGDVNNDGHDDVIVGARGVGWLPPVEEGAGAAYVYSGQTGALMDSLRAPSPESAAYFGCSVSGAGDVDNDGYDDVIVGAYGEDNGATDAGAAYIYSGQTGGLIASLPVPMPEPFAHFGCSVSGAGDVDNDGYDDVIVGAYSQDCDTTDTGAAYIYSGQTGGLIASLPVPMPEPFAYFGCSVSGAGDVDNDGYDDVIVGACSQDCDTTDTGAAYIYSGQTGGLIASLPVPMPEPFAYFGCSVSGAGDVDNDGHADVVVGAYGASSGAYRGSAGAAYVYSWMYLSGGTVAEQLVLEWTPWLPAFEYWVYGADNQAYFLPGLEIPYQHRLQVLPSGTTNWSSTNGTGDPDHDWTYLVIAVDVSEQELARTARFAEFDFATGVWP